MHEELEISSEEAIPRSHDLLGVIAVICLAVLPDIYNAIVMWSGEFGESASFLYLSTALIVRSLQVSVPVLLIVKLSNIEWESIGLQRIRWGVDTAAGLGIWFTGAIGFYMAYYLGYFLFADFLFSDEITEYTFEGPQNVIDYALLLVVSCANGFAEELVIHGYLLTRLERLLKSTCAALLITTLLFATYHLYQGTASAIGIAGVGLVYGGAFCLWRRLWPLVIAHAVADFVGMMVL